jgi:ribosomal-protein-alanine N-acetyltransferase
MNPTESVPDDAPALPVLQGDRVRLREFRDDDVEALYTIYSDPRVMRYWSYPAWTEPAQAAAYLERVRSASVSEGVFPWAVARNDDDVLIGTTTLWHIDAGNSRAEIGYALASRLWGQGYAQEALRVALGFAFDVLQLRRIEADVDPRNVASCRLLERVGFTREGVLRERWTVGGELQDSAIHGLLRGELI